MAEKIFTNVRLGLKVDTLENWKSSSLVLKRGEVAFATVASSAGTGLSEPVCMMKIGDGEHTFSELGFDFYAKASDVLAACKSTEALTAFINNVIAGAGIATNEAMQALTGRVGTAEGKITALEGTVGNAESGLVKDVAANTAAIEAIEDKFGYDTVALEIEAAINGLNLGTTYAAKAVETTVANHMADTVAHMTTAEKTTLSTALQASDIATGGTNGTIAVKGTDVAVKGLGSAAFTESTAYDAAGAAAGAESAAKAYAKEYADGLAGNYDTKGAAAAAQAAAQSYADGLAGNYDAAGSADDALEAAKAYVDEQTGGKTVSDAINTALANYSTTEQMNTAIGTAKGEAVAHANSLNTAMDERVQALEAIDHEHANKDELDLIAAGDVAKWNAAEQNAKDYADGLDDAMDVRMKAVEAKLGTGEGGVDAQINAAVAAEAKLREDADKALDAKIGVASSEGVAATGLHADIEALEGLIGGTSVSEQILAETTRATGVESGLDARLKAVEDDYLKAADKTELEGKIKSNADAIELLTNGVDTETVDGVNDLIQYVKDHGTEVTGIKADIKTNADDIDALEGRMDAAEDAIDHKAAQADLELLAGRVTIIETEHNTETTGLKARLTQAEADINALETKVGDKTVAEQIEAAIADVKADASNKDAVVLAEAQSYIDAHSGNGDIHVTAEQKAAWNAAVQTVTAGTGLTATKTGTDVAIAFDDSVTFIFDCGGAE